MGTNRNVQVLDAPGDNRDELHLTSSGIQADLRVFGFIDKDTKQHVVYIPAFQLSGYGESRQKAEEMLKFSIHDYLHRLRAMSDAERGQELSGFGWRADMQENEGYSNTYIGTDGELENCNAEAGTVQRITLETV